MSKHILVLGGGVAGCSLAYFLYKKGYEVTIIEKLGKKVGGLARTYYYAGHPYEFGPHVWFWQDPSPANDVVRELTNNELFHVGRRLFSFVAEDEKLYRYPIHYEDIKDMPDKKEIEKFLHLHRNEDHSLKYDEIPTIGKCTFADYFCAAIGKPLFNKFMRNYSWKMWNIKPEELQTSMVWADRVKHSVEGSKKGTPGYDPIKFTDHCLGQELDFQVYPKVGWNIVWDGMVRNATIIKGDVIGIYNEDSKHIAVRLEDGTNQLFPIYDYEAVISTLGIDHLLRKEKLPYAGRMMIPVMLPYDNQWFPAGLNMDVFPGCAESIHYSGAEFHTRVTDIDLITQYESINGRLLLVEVPISAEMQEGCFPENTITYAKENNLFAKDCYAHQSTTAIARYQELLQMSKDKYPTLHHCGRHAEFRYVGMPETVDSAYKMVEEKF